MLPLIRFIGDFREVKRALDGYKNNTKSDSLLNSNKIN